MKAIIVGIPGTGKTSVAKGLEPHGWKTVTFGTVMFDIAKGKYGLADRDEMRSRIPVEEYKKLQEDAAKKIGGMEGKILVDTHCSILKPEGYYPGLPANILERLKPDAIVVVEARAEDIEKRRKKDEGERTREGNAGEHQEINRYLAAAYSAISGAPVSFVMNEEGKLGQTVERVAAILNG
jgi:adenylate kinase